MQGVPCGQKIYNNYAIVNSTVNEQYVSGDDLVFIGNDGEYHKITCDKPGLELKTGYLNSDFARKSVTKSESEIFYYYKHNETACYECIVSAQSVKNSIDELNTTNKEKKLRNIRYYTALAREKYKKIKR